MRGNETHRHLSAVSRACKSSANAKMQLPRGEKRRGLAIKLSWASHFASGVLVIAIAALLGGGFTCWGRSAATEIFEGITYGCKRLESSEEGGGVVHWVRVDLTAPGIDLYVTPLDPSAVN